MPDSLRVFFVLAYFCLLLGLFSRNNSTPYLVHNDFIYIAGVEILIQKLKETEDKQ